MATKRKQAETTEQPAQVGHYPGVPQGPLTQAEVEWQREHNPNWHDSILEVQGRADEDEVPVEQVAQVVAGEPAEPSNPAGEPEKQEEGQPEG